MKRHSAVLVIFFLLSLFPALAQNNTGEIVRADYGSGNQWADVTERVRSLAASSPRFRVDDDTLGVYSRTEGTNSLRVEVRDQNGNSRQLTFRQNEYANLSGYTSNIGNTGQYNNNYQQGDFQITSARYGTGYRVADVTDLLNSRIQNGRLQMTVSSSALSGDPAPGRSKTLSVHYTFNGHPAQAIFRDGEEVRLPEPFDGYAGGQANNSYGNLQIRRARYGSGDQQQDVTARLNSQIRNGELHLQVTDAAMGVYSSGNAGKTLTVDYEINGDRRRTFVRQGETLNLPEGTQAYGNAGNNSGAQALVCGSTGNARHYCAADTRGGVRLSRQLSSAACRQGSSWGYDDRGVWVSNGCRAEFQLSSAYASSTYGAAMVIPTGTELSVRTNEDIDSSQATEGQKFSGVMSDDVKDASGNVAIPKGSDVQLVIRSAEGSNLALDIDSVSVGGRQYTVSTADLEKKGGSGIGANKRTATIMGGGAVAGAVIGAILGGGKGAAIGAAVGAAGGAGVQVLTSGKQVKVPAETVLTFRLDSDLQLQATSY